MTDPASAPLATSDALQSVPFPAAVAAPRGTDDIERRQTRRATASTDAAPRTRVLWIDDQPELMGGLVACLAREGFEVEFATTGAAGFRMASSAAYDIILLDLRLPDISGMDLLERIQSAGVRTPIIVLTGYGSLESAFEAGLARAAAFKAKPLRAVDLLRTIRSAIDSSTREKPARLFRESRGDGPSPSVRRIVRLLSEIPSLTDARDISAGLEVRNALRRDLLREAVDPDLTLPEFIAMTEAIRLVSSDERAWSPLALQHVLDLFDAASRCDWARIDETVRRLVTRLTGSGKACLHMDEHAVAHDLGVDRNDLLTHLRNELGLSVAQLRHVIVMRRAVQMLAVTDEQVAQIAYALGFEHPSPFNRSFASFFGVSPRAFRKIIRARSSDGA